MADAGALTGEGDAFADDMAPVSGEDDAISGKMAPVSDDCDSAIAGDVTPILGDMALIASEEPCTSTSDAFSGEMAPITGELAPLADDVPGFVARGTTGRIHCL